MEHASILMMIVALALGYLLGSVPFGLVLCRLFGYGDIRKIGSGNIGATNVLRTGNKPLAAATLLLDSGKGAVAVIATHLATGTIFDLSLVSMLAGMGAVIGHNFPIWLGFKGGKGVATTLGTYGAVFWPLGLFCCLTWLIAAAIFRMSSASALIALAAAPVFSYLYGSEQLAIITGLLGLLCWVRHRANIRRILDGTEPRIGKKKDN